MPEGKVSEALKRPFDSAQAMGIKRLWSRVDDKD